MSLRGEQSSTKQSRMESSEFFLLNRKITSCKKCPRLVEYISEIREKYEGAGVSNPFWCKPVPGFGDIKAKILILGLAPGRFGSNRTGRMFTGDSSGNFMYPILHEVGLCNQPNSIDINDGLNLKDCYITAVGRCAPPQNKPTKEELENCFPYLEEELRLLKDLKVVVALGKIAFDGYIKGRHDHSLRHQFKFSHGAIYDEGLPHILISSYHPSRQNTQTGRLTKKMFRDVFENAIRYC